MKRYELSDDIYEKVTELSKEGDACFDKGHVEKAIATYNKALDLIPRPITEWEAATWLYAAIGDAYWTLAQYQNSYDAFYNALKSPGGIGNPFIHLRMGQLQLAFGDAEKARDELMRAYMGAGKDIFRQEDPRYFAVIEELI